MEVVPRKRRPYSTLEKLEMKKTLVALAALAVTGAYAQSGVTLTGVVDVGYATTNVDLNSQAKFGGLSTNGVSTTAFFFKGTEDLGGGLKAQFLAELDWSPTLSNGANQNSSTSSLGGIPYTGTPFNGEQFLGLEGNFGYLKLGTVNSPALDTSSMSQPFGTALGSGFSSSFGRLGTASTSGYNQYVGAEGSAGRIIRHNKSIGYTTPTLLPGLKAQIEYVAQNANGAWTANDNGVLSTALRFQQGPINAMWNTTKVSAGSIASSASASWTGLAATAATLSSVTGVSSYTASKLAANGSVTFNMLGGNYSFGNNTVYAGFTTTKTDGVTANGSLEDSKSQNIGYKYVMGNVDLLANYLTRKSGLTSNEAYGITASNFAAYTPTQKMLGLGINYNLSKNTMLYGRYEKITGLNTGSSTATAASTGVLPNQTIGGATSTKAMVGIRMAF